MEHEIQLLPDSLVPNIGLYIQFIMEPYKVNKQVQELLDQGLIRPNASGFFLSYPCFLAWRFGCSGLLLFRVPQLWGPLWGLFGSLIYSRLFG